MLVFLDEKLILSQDKQIIIQRLKKSEFVLKIQFPLKKKL